MQLGKTVLKIQPCLTAGQVVLGGRIFYFKAVESLQVILFIFVFKLGQSCLLLIVEALQPILHELEKVLGLPKVVARDLSVLRPSGGQ